MRIYTSTSLPSVALRVLTPADSYRVALPRGYEDPELDVAALDDAVKRVAAVVSPQCEMLLDLSCSARDEQLAGAVADVPPAVAARVKYLFSAAFATAAAHERGLALEDYLADQLGTADTDELPVPWITLISGGRVATTSFNVQSIMMVQATPTTMPRLVQTGAEVSEALGRRYKDHERSYAYGDEGGYGVTYEGDSGREVLLAALDDVETAVTEAGYRLGDDVVLAIDFAAKHICVDAGYVLATDTPPLPLNEMSELMKEIAARYAVRYIEDPLWGASDEVLLALQAGLHEVGASLIADDVIHEGLGPDMPVSDGIVVMPDRIGTLSDVAGAVERIRDAGLLPIGSARSGETEDPSIASIAVAFGLPYVKAGGVHRSERTVKYNELLRIDERRHEKEVTNA